MGLFVFLDSGSQLECPAYPNGAREPTPLMGHEASALDGSKLRHPATKSQNQALLRLPEIKGQP